MGASASAAAAAAAAIDVEKDDSFGFNKVKRGNAGGYRFAGTKRPKVGDATDDEKCLKKFAIAYHGEEMPLMIKSA